MAVTWFVKTDPGGDIIYTNGNGLWVPDDMENRDRIALQEGIDAGEIVLAPWVPPAGTPAANPTATLADAVLLLGRSIGQPGMAWPDDLLAKLRQLQGGGP